MNFKIKSRCKVVFSILALILGSPDLPAAEPSQLLAPAKIERPIKETELSTITLTPEADRRLGVVARMAELRKLTRARLLGGEITLPARSGVSALASGGRLDRQSVFTILPLLSPAEQIRLAQSQIDADGQVEQAKVQVHATRQVQNRAEQMRRDKVGTERAVEDARVQVKLAVAALHTAQAHRNLLGPALLSTASPAEVWVRVPVYVGDLAKLDSSAEARIGGLGDAPGAAGRAARPVSAPPSTNAMVSTVDVFYQVANRDGAYRFGQRVGVTIPLRESQAGVVVPWSAIVHDAQGGTWVYEQSAPLVYVRRRVLVERVAGDLAVLAGGLKPGTSVVVSGAAELFGTEFGAGK